MHTPRRRLERGLGDKRPQPEVRLTVDLLACASRAPRCTRAPTCTAAGSAPSPLSAGPATGGKELDSYSAEDRSQKQQRIPGGGGAAEISAALNHLENEEILVPMILIWPACNTCLLENKGVFYMLNKMGTTCKLAVPGECRACPPSRQAPGRRLSTLADALCVFLPGATYPLVAGTAVSLQHLSWDVFHSAGNLTASPGPWPRGCQANRIRSQK